jgi:hypothetical protein
MPTNQSGKNPGVPNGTGSEPKANPANGGSAGAAMMGNDPLAPYKQFYGDLPNNWKPASKTAKKDTD